MPHIVFAGEIQYEDVMADFEPEVFRWERAVLKLNECWLRSDRRALLIEAVVVELNRPLHPIVQIGAQKGSTSISLWPRVDVERTRAVQRTLALIAARIQPFGTGGIRKINIPDELWHDLDLKITE